MTKKIKKLDFCYENLLVKVIADSDHPKIELAGLTVGPFKQGNEYYKTPTISTSYIVVEGQGSNYQLYDRTNGQYQEMPEMDIWGACLPVIIAIVLIVSAIVIYRMKKKRSNE